MTPDHVRGRLSSDAGVTSSSIISPTIPSPISTLSTAPFMMLSPASTTSDNLIHRRFPYGLLSLREKLIKIGTKVVRHGRYVTFQMAEVAVSRECSPTSCH